mmetsp:Transcript_977/g.2824  ORF Transcript_977/g.2824 Transcript_977/m.2824 type:complete len:205 (+) Transcript_977:429-1043(+)
MASSIATGTAATPDHRCLHKHLRQKSQPAISPNTPHPQQKGIAFQAKRLILDTNPCSCRKKLRRNGNSWASNRKSRPWLSFGWCRWIQRRNNDGWRQQHLADCQSFHNQGQCAALHVERVCGRCHAPIHPSIHPPPNQSLTADEYSNYIHVKGRTQFNSERTTNYCKYHTCTCHSTSTCAYSYVLHLCIVIFSILQSALVSSRR